MYRIDNSTAAASLPTPAAAGTPGYFTDGVPGTTAATIVPADWLNSVQEELAYAITQSGQSLSKTNPNQLAGAFAGRLIGVQRFVSGSATYTPTTGTKSVVVTVVGGGGAGGGAALNTASQYSVGSGGAAGSAGKGRFTTGFSGVTVTIGSGGTGVAGAAGNAGSSSSFGALISAPGGGPGAVNQCASSSTVAAGQAPSGAVATGGTIFNVVGQPGACGYVLANGAISGQGAGSIIGGGAQNLANAAGIAATTPGAGGGGAGASLSSGNYSGGAGAAGIVIVEEYA